MAMPVRPSLLAHLVFASMLALSLLAGVATLSGMIALLGGGLRGWLFGITLGLVIQLLILVALRILTHGRGFLRRISFAGLYAVLVAASVGLGYGFWFDLTASNAFARDTYRARMGELLAPLARFRHAYGELASASAEVARYSEARFAEETERGGTCGPQPRGPGPRARLRQRDADSFAVFADHFEARAAAFAELLAASEEAVAGFGADSFARSVQAADRALDEARAFAADPRLEAFRTTVRARLEAGRDGFTDPRTGERFTCPDARLETLLVAVAGVGLPELPAARAVFFEATHAASVQRGLQLLLGQARFAWERDALPVGMGLGIDLLLLLLALGERALHGRRRDGLAGLDPLDGGLDLPEGFAEALLAVCRGEDDNGLADLLAAWGLDDRGRAYLLAPQDAGTGDAAAVGRLALVLCELGLARPLLLRRPEQLPAWWREPRAEVLAPHRYLRVFRLRRRLLPLLLLAALRRRLAHGRHPSPSLLPPEPARERVL